METRHCDGSRFLLQKLSAEERKKAVADKIEKRKKIRVQILELSKKRDAFIQEERNLLAFAAQRPYNRIRCELAWADRFLQDRAIKCNPVGIISRGSRYVGPAMVSDVAEFSWH